jgi:L-threonylcarbamoyladenylate synthase
MSTTSTPPILSVAAAAEAVLQGNVIAYPTETVYGLGCRADQASGINQIIQAKNRDATQSFIVLVNSVTHAAEWIAPQDHPLLPQAAATWPGPTTWIFTAAEHVNPALTLQGSIALRISPHPLAHALCQRTQCALVSTSANLKGDPPLTNPSDIWHTFPHLITGIMEGETGNGRPSRIIDARSGKILRD